MAAYKVTVTDPKGDVIAIQLVDKLLVKLNSHDEFSAIYYALLETISPYIQRKADDKSESR